MPRSREKSIKKKLSKKLLMGLQHQKKTKQQFKIVDESEFEILKKFFGLNNLCDRSQFISNIDGPKKILVVSKGVAKLLGTDEKN